MNLQQFVEGTRVVINSHAQYPDQVGLTGKAYWPSHMSYHYGQREKLLAKVMTENELVAEVVLDNPSKRGQRLDLYIFKLDVIPQEPTQMELFG